MYNPEELESFSEKEVKNFKRLCIFSLIAVILSIISIIVYLYIRYTTERDLMFCQSTGLYRTIQNNKVIRYTSDESEVLDNENDDRDIAIQLAGDISSTLMGNDFTSDVGCDKKVNKYINTFCNNLNGDSTICLSDLFPEVYMEPFGDGEHIYYPYKMDSKTLYSKEWIDKASLTNLGYSLNSIIKTTEIPDRVKESFGTEILGYIPNESSISEFMSKDVKYVDGKFYTDVGNLRVESMYGYIDFFGEQEIDLFALDPSIALRELNPAGRFTWIMEDSKTKGKWHYIYFSNKYSDTLSVVSVKIESKQVTDIKIQGFDS